MSPDSPHQSNKSKDSRQNRLVQLILILIIAAAVAVAIYALTRPKNKTASNAPAHPQIQNADVSITKTGFVPATIQVKPGTQVVWTNTDSAIHQVAADPYPKDNSIPNFDSTVVLPMNASFSFVFPNTGTYTYHDERNPLQLKGTVIVK